MKITQKTIDIFKRFSMGNCATLRMDRYGRKKNMTNIKTYTAHLMSLDSFINFPKNNFNIKIPFDYWPYNKKYFLPKKIKTFIYSTFNEIYHPRYSVENSCAFTIPDNFKKRIFEKQRNNKPIKSLGFCNLYEYKKNIICLNKKVINIWGNVNRVLLFYDFKRAPKKIKIRARAFNKLAKNILGWKIVVINEKYLRAGSWQHYSVETYLRLLKNIELLEQ